MAKFLRPTLNEALGYIVSFNNSIYNPHARHNADQGGVIASTGFKVEGDTVNEQFFDDDGNGNLRRFFVLAGVKNYEDNKAGIVDYATGTITLNPLTVSQVLNVDGASSIEIRITALPDSVDIIPIRNQLVEIDLVNTVVNVGLDRLEVGDINTVNIADRATTSYTSTATGF